MDLRFDPSALRVWRPDEMPGEVRLQILAFMRQVWPRGFRGNDFLRGWIEAPQDDPLHVVALLPNGCVAAHAAAMRREAAAFGRTWRLGGLSGVFSFAQVRGLGWGRGVAARAAELLAERGSEAALFCCDEGNVGFYRGLGWERLPGNTLTVGTPPRVEPSPVMFRAFSPAGEELRERLASGTLHFGDYVW